MSDEIRVPVSLPLDDGFLRRECPTCEREFKWFSHDEDDVDAEIAEQYFCPLCGVGAGTDAWWTKTQLVFMESAITPEAGQLVDDALAEMFKGTKGITFKKGSSSTPFDPAEPLHEPNDMVAVEPPCHPNEPLKVPEENTSRVHCLICGSSFSA